MANNVFFHWMKNKTDFLLVYLYLNALQHSNNRQTLTCQIAGYALIKILPCRNSPPNQDYSPQFLLLLQRDDEL